MLFNYLYTAKFLTSSDLRSEVFIVTDFHVSDVIGKLVSNRLSQLDVAQLAAFLISIHIVAPVDLYRRLDTNLTKLITECCF